MAAVIATSIAAEPDWIWDSAPEPQAYEHGDDFRDDESQAITEMYGWRFTKDLPILARCVLLHPWLKDEARE